MEVERILEQLRVNRGSFPREAVVAAVEKRDEVAPRLVESIEHARRRADELPSDFMLHVFAMYLLAQFRERTAFRPILDFLTLPGRLALELTGDVVTEDMHRILACVAHGEIEPMLALVQRQDLDEYVRNAVLRGIVACHVCGELPEERLCSVLDGLFEGGLERDPSFVWATLATTCADLSLSRFRPQVERAFDAGLVDESVIRRAEALSELAGPRQPRRLRRYAPIEDTVAEMQGWACFRPEPGSPIGSGSAAVSAPKVGRNDPCPCGSGAKYKKCCMAVG